MGIESFIFWKFTSLLRRRSKRNHKGRRESNERHDGLFATADDTASEDYDKEDNQRQWMQNHTMWMKERMRWCEKKTWMLKSQRRCWMMKR